MKAQQVELDYDDAYLNPMDDVGDGGVGFECYLHPRRPVYLIMRGHYIKFVTFENMARAQEWFDEQFNDLQILWRWEPQNIKPDIESEENQQREAANLIEALLPQTYCMVSCDLPGFFGYELAIKAIENFLEQYKPENTSAHWLDED